MARVWCASAEIEPYDIAPVENLRTMLETGSTSSIGTVLARGPAAPGPPPCCPLGPAFGRPSRPPSAVAAGSSTPRMRSRPRRVISRAAWSSTSVVYSAKISCRRLRVACCSLKTVSGLNRCGSPSRRHWYSPPTSSRRCAGLASRGGNARVCRAAVSAAIWLEADAAEARRRPGEAFPDDLVADPDRLEDLGAGVGGDRGHAHLGHDLEHALAERLDQVGHGLPGGDLGDLPGADHVLDRLDGQVGTDSRGPVADEQGDVVALASVSGLHDQASPGPGPLPDQVVVHRAGEQ